MVARALTPPSSRRRITIALVAIPFVLGVLVWTPELGGAKADDALTRHSVSEDAARDAARLTAPASPEGRATLDALASDVSTETLVGNPPLASLAVFATDIDGVPVSGIAVLAAPPRHPLNRLGATDSRGRFECSWNSTVWPAELVVELRGRDGREVRNLTDARRLLVDPGGVAELEVVLGPTLLAAHVTPVRFDPVLEGDPPCGYRAFDDDVELYSIEEFESDVGTEAVERAQGRADEPTRERSSRPPEYTAAWDPAGLLQFVAEQRLATGIITDSFETSVSEPEDRETPPTLARVEGQATDESGRPADRLYIEAVAPDGHVLARTRTDDEGRYSLELDADEVELHAGLGALAWPRHPARGAKHTTSVLRGGRVDWSPRVTRGPRLELAEATVNYVRIERLEKTPSGERLRIAVALGTPRGGSVQGLTSGVADIDVADLNVYEGALPTRDVVTIPGFWRDPEVPKASLRLNVDDLAGPLAAELWVWDGDGRRGVRLPVYGQRGTEMKTITRIGIGSWRASVGGTEGFWSDERSFVVTGESTCHLGTFAFGPRGAIELPALAADEPRRSASVMRIHAGAPSIVLPRSLSSQRRASRRALPVGEYVWLLEGVAPAPFELAANDIERPPWVRIAPETAPK